MLEGVKNIYYKSNSSGKGSYTTYDHNWYFPWNKDRYGLVNTVQKYFDRVILFNKYKIETIKKYSKRWNYSEISTFILPI